MQNELSNACNILKYDIESSVDSIMKTEMNEIYLVERMVEK